MNRQTFEQLVERRANERVQQKIGAVRKAVFKALDAMAPGTAFYNGSGEAKWPEKFTRILDQLSNPNNTKGWPKYLWVEEREKVTKELFDIMDEMQRALLAKPVGEDCANEMVTDETVCEKNP